MDKTNATVLNNQNSRLLLDETAQVQEVLEACGFIVTSQSDFNFSCTNHHTTIHYSELRGVRVIQKGSTVLEFNPLKKCALQIVLALHCFDVIDLNTIPDFKAYISNERTASNVSAMDTHITTWPLLLSSNGLRNLRTQKTAKA